VRGFQNFIYAGASISTVLVEYCIGIHTVIAFDMEHLPLVTLANVLVYLGSHDIASLYLTCKSFEPNGNVMNRAIGLVIKTQYGMDSCPFLFEDDPLWPRSALILKSAEMVRIKKLLIGAISFEDESNFNIQKQVFVSKAWILALRKQCQLYEQFLLQFRSTKKKSKAQRQISLLNQEEAQANERNIQEAKDLIICSHGNLLPLCWSTGRSKRMVLPRCSWKKIISLIRSKKTCFISSEIECRKCLEEKEEADKKQQEQKHDRFEKELAGSNGSALLDLFLRKNGYPKELFSPNSTNRESFLSFSHASIGTYFLVSFPMIVSIFLFVSALS
jgi:hypothetical protein